MIRSHCNVNYTRKIYKKLKIQIQRLLMKALRRMAENDIITRSVTVKIQQVAVRGNYENPTNDAKGEDE